MLNKNFSNITSQNKIEKAQNFLKKGEIEKAKNELKDFIKENPKNSKALHFLGVISAQSKDRIKGIEYLKKAIEIEPENAGFLSDMATAMQSIGRKKEAISYYEKAIEKDPKLFQAYYNLGNIYGEKNEIEKSIESYKKAIEINPKFAPAYNNLGNILKATSQTAHALYMYQNACIVDPNYVPAYNNLGLILQDMGKSDEAVNIFQKAISINPNYLELYINLANSYKSERRYLESIELYKKVIEKNPNYVFAYNNLGLTYQEMGEDEKALSFYKKAIEKDPNFADSYSNMGSLYQKMNNFEKALEYYEKAIEKRENYSQALFNISTIHFLRGDYKKAWKYHEARLNFKDAKEREIKYLNIQKAKKWNGEELFGKKIFVYSEQGYGDSIQFSRYLSLLKDKGALKVIFKPQETLEKLFQISNIGAEILPPYIEKDKFVYDFYIPLLSLPYYFQTDESNVPKTFGYLKADKEKVNEYKEKYFQTEKFKVGIVWQGFKGHSGDLQRSISLKSFLPIFQENIQVYSLQKGNGEGQLLGLPDVYNVIELGKSFRDFADAAAAIENLDLIIGVDTAISHLSAAMGKNTWVLIPKSPDWRWGLKGSKTIWYESMKLFRQEERNKWKEVFYEMAEELKNLKK